MFLIIIFALLLGSANLPMDYSFVHVGRYASKYVYEVWYLGVISECNWIIEKYIACDEASGIKVPSGIMDVDVIDGTTLKWQSQTSAATLGMPPPSPLSGFLHYNNV